MDEKKSDPKVIQFHPNYQSSPNTEVEKMRRDLRRQMKRNGKDLDRCIVKLAHLLMAKVEEGYGVYLEKDGQERLMLKL